MISSASKATEITSLLNGAVDKLKELAHYTTVNRANLELVDISGVYVIIDALKELERERLKLHELLETETIKASVLRYKLQYFPGDIKAEVQAAVNSARQSNEAEIRRIKDQLNSIDQNIKALGRRHQDLLTENARLEPERDDMQTGHDEIIALLNQKMADKASKQITLNETRDRLRETYKKIIDLEESIVQLKEDLIHEREEAQLEKEKLKQSVANTQTKVEGQRRTNVLKRREIDKLQEELVDSDSMLDTKRKIIRKYETSRARLEAQGVQLNRQLQKEIRDNSTLTQEGMKTVRQSNAMREKLEEQKEKLEDELEKLQNSLASAVEEDKELALERNKLSKELEVALEEKEKDGEVVREHERQLIRAKESLSRQNEECSRIQNENIELEGDIGQLKESHEATVDVFNKQIEESKVALSVERKDRKVLQTKRDVVTKESNEFKADYGRYMATMSKKVVEGKAEHARLTEYGTQLQKDLKQDEEDIMKKQKELKQAKHNYTVQYKKLKGELTTLRESISKHEQEKNKKKEIIEDKTPIFKDLEIQFKERTEEFETTKKTIVDLKNKKATLETSVQRAQRDVEKMAAPQSRLRENLRAKRTEALDQLKRHSADVQKVEKEIFASGQKLGAVLKENHRFKQAITQLQEEIENIRKQMSANTDTKETLRKQLLEYRDTLNKGWKEDALLDKVFAERDVRMLSDICKLQEETHEREGRIDTIHVQLQDQLAVLAHFLDGVANLRPPDTAQSDKKNKKDTAQSDKKNKKGKQKETSVRLASPAVLPRQGPTSESVRLASPAVLPRQGPTSERRTSLLGEVHVPSKRDEEKAER